MSSSPSSRHRNRPTHGSPTKSGSRSVNIDEPSSQVNQGERDAPKNPPAKFPVPVLKPRPSRWADEVDEDDQFIPTKRFSSTQEPTRQRSDRSETAPHPTAPSRRTGIREEVPLSRRGQVPLAPRQLERRVTPQHNPVSVQSPAGGPTREELDEIIRMKDIMTKKAEERKKAKEEEEAKFEAERRARCEAKLREIELKKIAKSTTVFSQESKSTTLLLNQPSQLLQDPKLATNRQAFYQKRREIRDKREGKEPSVITPTEIITPAGTRLSAQASEFVPIGPPSVMPPQPPQWMPPYGYPQQQQPPPPHHQYYYQQPYGYPYYPGQH